MTNDMWLIHSYNTPYATSVSTIAHGPIDYQSHSTYNYYYSICSAIMANHHVIMSYCYVSRVRLVWSWSLAPCHGLTITSGSHCHFSTNYTRCVWSLALPCTNVPLSLRMLMEACLEPSSKWQGGSCHHPPSALQSPQAVPKLCWSSCAWWRAPWEIHTSRPSMLRCCLWSLTIGSARELARHQGELPYASSRSLIDHCNPASKWQQLGWSMSIIMSIMSL